MSYVEEFGYLSLEDQEEEEDEGEQQPPGRILLGLCSWNPNPDNRLPRSDAKKCIYGTLGALDSDVLCLQETIWVPRHFPGWETWFKRGSTEAAILYKPAKLEVDEAVAKEADDAWRDRVESIKYALGKRTVALQGTILSTHRYSDKI
jgi:hypothetical protein